MQTPELLERAFVNLKNAIFSSNYVKHINLVISNRIHDK